MMFLEWRDYFFCIFTILLFPANDCITRLRNVFILKDIIIIIIILFSVNKKHNFWKIIGKYIIGKLLNSRKS